MLKGGKNQRGLDRTFRQEEGKIGHNGVTGTRLPTLPPLTTTKLHKSQQNDAFQMLDNRLHRTVTFDRKDTNKLPMLH